MLIYVLCLMLNNDCVSVEHGTHEELKTCWAVRDKRNSKESAFQCREAIVSGKEAIVSDKKRGKFKW